jgi:TetR/AcrR family transcriptional repressor of lmrAB and yxaGH operons
MSSDTRQRMLEATARLLRERGYSGTSLNDILAASGAPRGSLYYHFPGGKDDLVTEVTCISIDQVTGALSAIFENENKPSRAVRKIFSATAEMLRANDFTQGCPVAPIVLDGTRNIPELTELCRTAFSTWIGLFADAFERAGIRPDRAQRLAMLVESAIEGVMVIARATSDARPLDAVVDEIAALLDDAVANSKTQ